LRKGNLQSNVYFIRRRIDVYAFIGVVLQKANDTGGMMASEGSQPFISLFEKLLPSVA
jgi:hypothetical protein